MADWQVTITLVVPFEARNETQAEERAARVEGAVKLDLSKEETWAGDMEITSEIEEV